MARFACTAKKHGFITTQQFSTALSEQWRQERHSLEGFADKIGKIFVDQGFMTEAQRKIVLNDIAMEPHISWGKDTPFAKSLFVNKLAKQTIGNFIGQGLAGSNGETVFLGGSSTIYYAFLGLIKHGATVYVRTINAAILAAYPSSPCSLGAVISVWEGSVDIREGIIKPADHLANNPAAIKEQAGFGSGGLSCVLISATGFNCNTGPLGKNETARMVARKALMSQTPVWILIDHTKIQTGRGLQHLLFPDRKKWGRIRDKGNIRLIVNCHPEMPSKQADLDIDSRSTDKIKKIMAANKRSEEDIRSVVQYCDWTMRVRDMICEIPYKKMV